MDFGTKVLTLQSDSSQPDAVNRTIVDGRRTGTAIKAGSGVLNGLTIRNGQGSLSNGTPGGVLGGSLISNCVITGNRSPTNGGRISSAGTIRDCLIADNHAEAAGGGLWLQNATVKGCTIVSNTAVNDAGGTGTQNSHTAQFDTCIVWGNTIVSGETSTPSQIGSTGTTLVNYSCVEGGYSGTGSDNNIDLDPGFKDGSFHLSSDSPCVDHGNPEYAPTAGETDIDGQARMSNDIPDMGCDEADRVQNQRTLAWYGCIQEAIDAAQGAVGATPGDTLVAHPGIYAETVDFAGKGLTLQTTDPENLNTTICDGLSDGQVVPMAVSMAGTPPTQTFLKGFTIMCHDGVVAGGAAVSYCTITASSVGGIRNGNGSIEDCNIHSNSGPDGGGIHNYDGTVSRCVIYGNHSDGGGGGLSHCSGEIRNCLIAGNTAPCGAGVSGDEETTTLTNCTLADNTGPVGSAVWVADNTSVTLSNCILWGNTMASPQIQVDSGASATLTYCCVQDADPNDSLIWPGDGNIDDDPLYRAPGDYQLSEDSPCVDSGDPQFEVSGEEKDLAGRPRACQGKQTSGVVVDMGAYEYQGLSVDAGPTVVVLEGQLVQLQAFASSQEGYQVSSWSWDQTAGTTVSLNNRTQDSPSFTAPMRVSTANHTLTFRVTVQDDHGNTASDTVDVTVRWMGDVNGDSYINVGDLQLLVMAWGSDPSKGNWNAGADVTGDGYVNVGDLQLVVSKWGQSLPEPPSLTVGEVPAYVYETWTVGLTCTAVSPRNDPLTYLWTQTGGAAVELAGAATASASFTVPTLSLTTDGIMTFSITVSDGLEAMDTVSVDAFMMGDVNHDNYVNVGDLQTLVAAWASEAGPPASSNWNAAADTNADGYVNVGDLQLLVDSWGRSLSLPPGQLQMMREGTSEALTSDGTGEPNTMDLYEALDSVGLLEVWLDYVATHRQAGQ